MSWQATAWAKTTRGHRSHGEKLLLMILADYADPETWEAWPGQDRLAEDCEMSKRNIIYSLKSLQTGGFLTRIQRGNSYMRSRYQLHQEVVTRTVSAKIAHTGVSAIPDTVLVQSSTGVSARKRTSSRQEEPIELIPNKAPAWVKVLGRDKRFKYDETWVEDIKLHYENRIDLESQALKCLTWLQDTATGKRRKNLRLTFHNWLDRSIADAEKVSVNGHQNGHNIGKDRMERLKKVKANATK